MASGAATLESKERQRRQTGIAAEFDAWAPTYETGRLAGWYQMHAREVFARLDLSEVRRVLDIGCGTGWALRQLAKKFPDKQFVGLDLSVAMVAEARKCAAADGLDNLKFFQADWEEAGPLIAAQKHAEVEKGFDLIFAFSSLHYVQEIRQALVSIRECLYEDGKFVLVERDTEGSFFTHIWGALHRFVLKDGVEFADTEELVRTMRTVGFDQVSVIARKRHLLRHGKFYTSVALIQGFRGR